MPWPLRPSRAHSPASWPGTGLAAGSTSAACGAATRPPSPSTTCKRSPRVAAASCPGSSCGKFAAMARIRAAMTSSRSSPGLCALRVTVTSGAGSCRSGGPRSMRITGSPGAVVKWSQRIWRGGSGRSSSTPCPCMPMKMGAASEVTDRSERIRIPANRLPIRRPGVRASPNTAVAQASARADQITPP